MDLEKFANTAKEMETITNSYMDKLKVVKENIYTLLNDNPDFNQTLHELDLQKEYYDDIDIEYQHLYSE